MPKKLDQLDASKAGVSQAELEDAFLSLATLAEELAEVEAESEKLHATKVKAKQAVNKANIALDEFDKKRDPIRQEYQRADWIVRNADPDHPPPPMGGGPRVIAKRVNS